MLLCSRCYANDIQVKLERADDNEPVIEIPVAQSEKVYNTARSIFADLPANGSEFYNAKVIAIVELEKKINEDPAIENKPYFFAQQIQARQNQLYKALIEVRELVTEIEAEKHANYRALNALASRLKREEREKLNLKYAEYTPVAKVKLVKQPRLKAEDKVIIDIARLMFAPRKDGIIQWEALEASDRQKYIEQARQYFKGNLK
jgi:hypothetical protein